MPEGECPSLVRRRTAWPAGPAAPASSFVRENRTIRKTFRSQAEAKAWRGDAHVALRRGTLSGAKSATLSDAATAWFAGAATNRSGDVYKPSTIRGYEQALRLRVLPDLGPVLLSAIERAELQAFVDRLLEADHDPSTIRNTLLPVRAIFRRAVARGEVAVNPTTGLELPALRGRRDRIASLEEARQLLAALDRDRALWATAMYSGLRMGELRALEWNSIDFARGLIHVRRTWDHIEARSSRSRAPAVGAFRSHRCSAPTLPHTASHASGATGLSSVERTSRRSTRARSTTGPAARGRR